MRLAIAASLWALVLTAVPATLSAQEPVSLDLAAAMQKAVLQASATDALVESFALQQGGAAPHENEHKFGLGVRTGGSAFGLGVTLRSWFQSSWGVQVGVTHYGYGDFFNVSYSSTEFTPAVLYGFTTIKLDAPLSLRPYAGAGVSIIRSSFSYLNNVATTNTGVLVLGGVELFFEKVPQLGVSGELEFTPSNTPYVTFNSVGGPGFVALAHWYFM